jgi:hypothetical protein
MLQLTPLDQTTAGRQIYERGFKQGLVLGRLAGQILLAQQFLKKPLSPKDELKEKTEEELKAMLKQLEIEVGASLKLSNQHRLEKSFSIQG